MNKTIDTNMTEVSVVYNLLGITSDNSFYWSKVEWRIHCRSQLKWYIRRIDVTSVKKTLAFMTNDHRPVRAIWVTVDLVTSAQ